MHLLPSVSGSKKQLTIPISLETCKGRKVILGKLSKRGKEKKKQPAVCSQRPSTSLVAEAGNEIRPGPKSILGRERKSGVRECPPAAVTCSEWEGASHPLHRPLLLPFPPRHPGQVDTLSAFRGLDPSPTVFPPQGESLQHAGSRLDL